MDDTRKYFENHAASEGLSLDRIYESLDVYQQYTTMVAWSAWQAALSYRPQPDFVAKYGVELNAYTDVKCRCGLLVRSEFYIPNNVPYKDSDNG